MVSMCVCHVRLRFNKFGLNSVENKRRTTARFTFFFEQILTVKRDNNSVSVINRMCQSERNLLPHSLLSLSYCFQDCHTNSRRDTTLFREEQIPFLRSTGDEQFHLLYEQSDRYSLQVLLGFCLSF